jgi:hypothetical protein
MDWYYSPTVNTATPTNTDKSSCESYSPKYLFQENIGIVNMAPRKGLCVWNDVILQHQIEKEIKTKILPNISCDTTPLYTKVVIGGMCNRCNLKLSFLQNMDPVRKNSA